MSHRPQVFSRIWKTDLVWIGRLSLSLIPKTATKVMRGEESPFYWLRCELDTIATGFFTEG